MSDNRSFKTRYADDGFVLPLDIITAQQAAELRTDLEAAESELADDAERLTLLRTYPDRLLPSFDNLIRNPKIIEAVSQILGPDLLVWGAGLFIKEPNSTNIVSWHQDLTYWGLDDAEETTCWVALSDASTASGAMKFVPGSHKERAVDHIDTFDKNNLLSRGQEIAVDVDENDAVAAELSPGQASIHHGHLFHASGPNSTNDRRIGTAIRYIKASLKQNDGTKSLVAHVSGEDKWHHFKVAPPPKSRLHDDDFELCRQDALAKRKILFAGVD